MSLRLPYVRIWKKREGRWLSVAEYRYLYLGGPHPVFGLEWRSRNPVMERLVATLQTVKGGQYIPEYSPLMSGALGTTAFTVDAADEKFAMVIDTPKAGEVAKILYRTGTVTTGATMDARLETVDGTTGDPSGTLVDTNSNVSVAIADADDNKTFVSALTATATVTQSQVVAIVIVNPAVSAGTMTFLTFDRDGGMFPYTDLFTTVWTKNGADAPIGGLEYDDGSYEPIVGCWPIGTTSAGGAVITKVAYNTGSTPDEIGMIWSLPYPGRVRGFWFYGDLDGDGDMILYDSNGTTAQLTVSLDANIRSSANENPYRRLFAGTFEFAANTNYRIALKPTSVTSLSLYEVDVPSASAMDGLSGGQSFHKTSQTDTGGWTEVTTKRPVMGILIDQFDDGAGGGGIIGQSLIGGSMA